MKNNKYIGKYITVLLLTFFVGISTVFAQADKQYGTRISDTKAGNQTLRENVILELDSKDKGFMLPRVTTAQRDRLVKDKTADNGLAIYNVDIDCVEFWSERTEKWMSVCGSLPPAKLDLSDNACQSVKFLNINYDEAAGHDAMWQQGKALDPAKHFMKINVKVESVGTYSISATTENGYFFSAEGQFQSVGSFDVLLKGMGTPIKGYNNDTGLPGDKFEFNFNGKVSAGCQNIVLKVIPADLAFTIKNAPSGDNIYKVDGGTKGFVVGKAATLRDGQKLSIDINVTSPGIARITALSGTELGMKFSGEHTSTQNGNYTVVLEPVAGENIPKTNVNASYELTFSTNAKEQSTSINSQKASIVISETKIEPVGTKATFGTEKYFAGTNLTANHTITLPIKVVAAGKTTLRLKDASGKYEFEAKDVELDNPTQPTDEQLVTFKAKSLVALPATTGNLDLTLSGDQTRLIISGTDKVVKLPIAVKPVAYTIKCAGIKSNRSTIVLKKPIGKTYYIEVPVNVTVAGEYEIKTETAVDGIIFSSNLNGVKQSFDGTGDKLVKLYATDETIEPSTKGVTVTKIVTNDANTAVGTCTPSISIKVGNVDLKILYASYEREMGAIERYFLQGDRFGEKGSVVETGAVSVEKIGMDLTYSLVDYNNAKNKAIRKSLADKISSGDYNFIILDGFYALNGSYGKEIADALDYYVKNFKGFVIIPSSQGSRYFSDDFIQLLEEASYGEGEKRTQVFQWIGTLNGTKFTANSESTNDDNIGFVVPNSRFTFSTHYKQPTGYGLYRYKKDVKINVNGGNFVPILKSRQTDGSGVGSVFIHNQYNVIFAPMLDSTQDRDFIEARFLDAQLEYDMKIPMDIINGQKRAYTTFQGNLFAGIITALMNQ